MTWTKGGTCLGKISKISSIRWKSGSSCLICTRYHGIHLEFNLPQRGCLTDKDLEALFGDRRITADDIFKQMQALQSDQVGFLQVLFNLQQFFHRSTKNLTTLGLPGINTCTMSWLALICCLTWSQISIEEMINHFDRSGLQLQERYLTHRRRHNRNLDEHFGNLTATLANHCRSAYLKVWPSMSFGFYFF